MLIVCFLLLPLLSSSLRPNFNAQTGTQQQQPQQPTMQMQVQQPYSPPPPQHIVSALIQKDESRSIGIQQYYNILAPTKIDLSRFVGGQIYDIVLSLVSFLPW